MVSCIRTFPAGDSKGTRIRGRFFPSHGSDRALSPNFVLLFSVFSVFSVVQTLALLGVYFFFHSGS